VTDRSDVEGTTDPDPGESPFVGAPFVAQGEALPGSPGPLEGAFRWVVLAQGFSSLAFWATFGTMFAEATNRFHATSSQMAVLGAALSVPFILGSLLQGLVVDRWSPKWTAVIGYSMQVASIPIAFAAPSLPWIWAAAFVIGGAFATIEPARSALTSLLVPEDRLVRANGTLATAFQLALVLGSLAGGWLLEAWNADAVYAAAAGAALLPVLCMLMVPDVRQHGERPSVSFGDLHRGAMTAWRQPALRILLVVTVAGWTLVNVFFVLEPLFVRDVLLRQGNALLYLWGAHGLGALAGAIGVTRARNTAGREAQMVCAGVVLVGAGIVVYTAIGRYPVALVASAASGVGFALFFPPLLALIQRVIPEDQRGRVTSVFVALQETAGLASSLALLAFGGIVAVQPTLVASGVVLTAMGVLGLRAVGRSPTEVAGDRAPA
jgi:MFS family permease